jgi:hypothetical protein
LLSDFNGLRGALLTEGKLRPAGRPLPIADVPLRPGVEGMMALVVELGLELQASFARQETHVASLTDGAARTGQSLPT